MHTEWLTYTQGTLYPCRGELLVSCFSTVYTTGILAFRSRRAYNFIAPDGCVYGWRLPLDVWAETGQSQAEH